MFLPVQIPVSNFRRQVHGMISHFTHWGNGLLLSALFILVPALCGQVEQAVAETRPNIILFMADDMAWDDCGAYGHPHIQTPNLDRLAAQGMRFDQAYLTCSSCSPSRSSIICGRYPHSTGEAWQLHNPLPADQVTFAELLRESGYYTALAGKLHPRKTTETRFDKIYPLGPPTSGGTGNWLKCLNERPEGKPFFLWLAAVDPHRPYQPETIPRPHLPEETVVPPYLPDVPEVREDLALYYDEITRIDLHIGQVLAALEQQGLAENTLVVFMSDNGRAFPRCKTTVHSSGVKTPLLMRWPGKIPAGSQCQSLISSIDLAPTFCQLAGVPLSSTFQGVEASVLFTNPEKTIRPYAFAEHNWHNFEDHQRGCRSLKFNYIRTAYTDVPGTPPADAVRSATYQAMHKLREQGKLTGDQLQTYTVPRPAEELYDLENDPHELKNLVDDPRYAAVLKQHRAVLDEWIQQTEDFIPAQRRPDDTDRYTGEKLQK